MSTKINSISVGHILVQSGIGAPNHTAPKGSIYVDVTNSNEYLNRDGSNTWKLIANAEEFLSLSGGTVTGHTTFTSGLTASNVSVDNYIDFNTNPTVPLASGGTLYFDSNENALSYKPITNNNDVTINIGQESLIRIYNNLGFQINNGQVIHITGSTSGAPTVCLAIASNGNNDKFQTNGVATHDIPSGQFGFVTYFGLVRDVDLTGFSVGEQIYLSQSTPGGFSSFSGLSYSGRISEVGHVVDNSLSGKVFVQIFNELQYSNITALQQNILNGNNSSTGIFNYSGITLDSVSGTTFSVGPIEGWVIDNTSNPTNPALAYVKYNGQTGITATNVTTATETYLLITSAGTLTQQVTFPTPQQRRLGMYIGKLGHGNRDFLINAFNEPDIDFSPLSQLRDVFTPIKLINDGVYPSPNGANLSFNNSSGTLYGLGIGFTTNHLNPSSITVTAQTPTTFQYRTQTGGTATNRTTVDPANYDNNGVITAIGSPAKQATNQRIYLLQNGQIRMQYGQTVYADLTTAISAVQGEIFNTFLNFRDNAILIGILSLKSDASNLSDSTQAKLLLVSKFGETVGAAGGLSTTTLQQAYNNSTTPEIVINSTLDGLSIRNGTGNPDSTTHLLEGQNAVGNITSFITADGGFSSSSVSATTYFGLPKDVTVTGGTYINSGSSIIFYNNTGGTFTVTGITTSSQFTGGTVTGDTIFTSRLNANIFSATTYENLPVYQRLNDNDTVNFFNYCGSALSGTSQSSPTWNISRISWSSSTPTILSAYGAWTGRTTLIYT